MSSYRNQQYLPQQLHTTVEIAPSHGFEIKQTNNGYETYSQQQNAQHYNQNYQPISFQPDQHTTGPVIVLRIPGPQKYATHLQMLLQQYLEIRAAEYIKLLQEQELLQQQQQHTPQAHNYDQYSYEPTSHGEQMYQNQYRQSYKSSPHYQVQVQPAQIVYQKHEESTDDGSQPIHYSHDTVNTEQQDEHGDQYQYQPTYRPDARYPQQTEENEHYYHSDEYQHSAGDEHSQQQQHYVYPKISSTTESSLQITENFPRDTHTHAYFTKSTTKPSIYVRPHQSYQDHAQPQHYESYQPQNYHSDDDGDYYYENQPSDKDYVSPSEQSVITITQKTPAPYNYHAHPTQSVHDHPSHDGDAQSSSQKVYLGTHSTDDERAALKGAKRQTTSFTQEQYAKLNKLISRMKKKVAQVQKNKDE